MEFQEAGVGWAMGGGKDCVLSEPERGNVDGQQVGKSTGGRE